MIYQAKNNKEILFKRLEPVDFDPLCQYFQQLSLDTLNRFGPHLFDKTSILDLYTGSTELMGFVALEVETSEIIAYAAVKIGFLEHDCSRLQSYGLELDPFTDCTFAPSVADAWQSMGVGNALFHFIVNDLKSKGLIRIILWGGVQSDNLKAINYYRKNGFRMLGHFEYHGKNTDMILDIF